MSLSERSVVAKNSRGIFRVFAPQLAAKFGREVDGENGQLTVYDFAYETVVLTFEDHSVLSFQHAFVLEGDECYGVFTEHAGYHCIFKDSLVEVKVLFPSDRRRKPKYLKEAP
jgi:hypothetical protein